MNRDDWMRERAKERIKTNKEKLKELKKNPINNAKKIAEVQEQLNRDYEIAYGYD